MIEKPEIKEPIQSKVNIRIAFSNHDFVIVHQDTSFLSIQIIIFFHKLENPSPIIDTFLKASFIDKS